MVESTGWNMFLTAHVIRLIHPAMTAHDGTMAGGDSQLSTDAVFSASYT